ncbi:MBL fold metallo-hydrolase [Rhizobiaceae bacterium BDR2-2]|uniref:MBL fold metallo-hydrolase n=1 Tax=Ectorhizobium quercum TaxID=2965071 RepID=A0AAE3SV44_9HYPH|nr:MBL fold metallo-hydrolase [Ectorhizobium quercum]MCX8997343.1 MBL fold metallo-hydrolase [Ectorhizobium quercum]
MAELTAISGLGGKLPAAFLLEISGRRLLFDLGEGPQPGVLPDMSGIGDVDAICLSHAHMDHAGALQLAARIGNPPVYATAATLRQIPLGIIGSARRRILPARGEASIEGLVVTLGRSGHAPGGIWFHIAADGGFLYTGDWSSESTLLPFDPPPPATCMVTDVSYGDRDSSLANQIDIIATAAANGAVLPVPSGGRGPEMALALTQRGLTVRVCPQVRSEMEDLAADTDDVIPPGQHRELSDFLAGAASSPDWQPGDVIVAAEANGEAGLSAELVSRRGDGFRFVFSSHVPAGTPAAGLLAAGKARWLPWNVHPRLRDTLRLAHETGARHIVPAFAGPEDMAILRKRLKNRLCMERTLRFGPAEPIEKTG